MTAEKLLTVRDVSLILSVSEREVLDLVESNRLPAYKVGGVYLRFKPEHVEEFKRSFVPSGHKVVISRKYSFKEKVTDLFYLYDFYVLAILIIVLMLVVIFKRY